MPRAGPRVRLCCTFVTEYEGRCGSCGAFTRVRTDPKLGKIGECALQVFPPPIRAGSTCSRYRPRGAPPPPPPPRAAGEPRGRRAASAPRAAEPAELPAKRQLPLPLQAGSQASPRPKEIDIDMDIGEFRRVL